MNEEKRKQCVIKRISADDVSMENQVNGALDVGYWMKSSNYLEKTNEMLFVLLLRKEKNGEKG